MKFKFNLKDDKDLPQICLITDSDFGLQVMPLDKPFTRYGARGIVFNGIGAIAVINKVKKNEFKLPGGGIYDDENPEEAFIRECEEELGCNIVITKKLGYTIEEKSQENFEQLSYVYVGQVSSYLDNNKLTQQEQEEGAKTVWLDVNTALAQMEKSLNNLKGSEYDNVYRSRFIVKRDIEILKYYLNNYKTNPAVR